MSMTVTETPETRLGATYEDVLNAPAHKVAQLIGGTLHLHSRPAIPHTEAVSELLLRIRAAFGRHGGGPGGWVIHYEPELHLGEDVIVPDLAGWRLENFSDPWDAAWYAATPDWVCEVLSPSTRQIDAGPKSDIYARERVPHYWIVDPIARTLKAFALVGGIWTRIDSLSHEAQVSIPPFEAISFPLSELWFGGA